MDSYALDKKLELSFFVVQFGTDNENMQPYLATVNSEGFELVNLKASDPMHVLALLVKSNDHSQAQSFITEAGISSETYCKLCARHSSYPVDLKTTLEGIKDTVFLKNFALSYQGLDLKETLAIMGITKRLIDDLLDDASSMELAASINRLITFQRIPQTNSGFWGNDWHTFQQSSMINNLQYCISCKDLETTLLLLKRHGRDPEVHSNLVLILEEMPRTMDIDLIILMLDELRMLVKLDDWETREAIDLWVLECAEAIESLDFDAKKSLKLLQWTSKPPAPRLFTPSQQVEHLVFLSAETKYQESETRVLIRSRIEQLCDIVELADDHDFYVCLADYEKFTPAMIGKPRLYISYVHD